MTDTNTMAFWILFGLMVPVVVFLMWIDKQ